MTSVAKSSAFIALNFLSLAFILSLLGLTLVSSPCGGWIQLNALIVLFKECDFHFFSRTGDLFLNFSNAVGAQSLDCFSSDLDRLIVSVTRNFFLTPFFIEGSLIYLHQRFGQEIPRRIRGLLGLYHVFFLFLVDGALKSGCKLVLGLAYHTWRPFNRREFLGSIFGVQARSDLSS